MKKTTTINSFFSVLLGGSKGGISPFAPFDPRFIFPVSYPLADLSFHPRTDAVYSIWLGGRATPRAVLLVSPDLFSEGTNLMASSGIPFNHDSQPLQAIPADSFDFEMAFYSGILARHPDYVDVLRALASLLSLKGRFADGLKVDKRLVELRPSDPLAHYNLACSYARMNRRGLSIKTLRKAVELGYRDFRYMREDNDLDPLREDPRFRKLLREYENS